MKIFTRKQLREHDCKVIDEMRDRQYMAERCERMENRIAELSMRLDRLERRLDMDPKPVCDGMPKEVMPHG